MAILAADAVDYSRLMSVDDRATVVALESARGVFRAHTLANDGRVIDTAGDSVLAVFETAAGAVTTALEAQQEFSAAPSALPEDRRMRSHWRAPGRLIEKADGTVYGDGVNIAARLRPRRTGASRFQSIRSAVKGKLSATFHDLGEQTVKNIADPVRVRGQERASDARRRHGNQCSAPVPGSAAGRRLRGCRSPTCRATRAGHFADGLAEDASPAGNVALGAGSRAARLHLGSAVDVKAVGRALGALRAEGACARPATGCV
jgi:adenylate cyclase